MARRGQRRDQGYARTPRQATRAETGEERERERKRERGERRGPGGRCARTRRLSKRGGGLVLALVGAVLGVLALGAQGHAQQVRGTRTRGARRRLSAAERRDARLLETLDAYEIVDGLHENEDIRRVLKSAELGVANNSADNNHEEKDRRDTDAVDFALSAFGTRVNIPLSRHPRFFAPDFAIWGVSSDGQLKRQPAQPALDCFFIGEGAVVSFCAHQVRGRILVSRRDEDDNVVEEDWHIEPLLATPGSYVVYRGRDLRETDLPNVVLEQDGHGHQHAHRIGRRMANANSNSNSNGNSNGNNGNSNGNNGNSNGNNGNSNGNNGNSNGNNRNSTGNNGNSNGNNGNSNGNNGNSNGNNGNSNGNNGNSNGNNGNSNGNNGNSNGNNGNSNGNNGNSNGNNGNSNGNNGNSNGNNGNSNGNNGNSNGNNGNSNGNNGNSNGNNGNSNGNNGNSNGNNGNSNGNNGNSNGNNGNSNGNNGNSNGNNGNSNGNNGNSNGNNGNSNGNNGNSNGNNGNSNGNNGNSNGNNGNSNGNNGNSNGNNGNSNGNNGNSNGNNGNSNGNNGNSNGNNGNSNGNNGNSNGNNGNSNGNNGNSNGNNGNSNGNNGNSNGNNGNSNGNNGNSNGNNGNSNGNNGNSNGNNGNSNGNNGNSNGNNGNSNGNNGNSNGNNANWHGAANGAISTTVTSGESSETTEEQLPDKTETPSDSAGLKVSRGACGVLDVDLSDLVKTPNATNLNRMKEDAGAISAATSSTATSSSPKTHFVRVLLVSDARMHTVYQDDLVLLSVSVYLMGLVEEIYREFPGGHTISIEVAGIVTMDSTDPWPNLFSSTGRSVESSALLTNFTAWTRSNAGALPDHDLAHLVTGWDLYGSNTGGSVIGLAYVGTVCDKAWKTGISQGDFLSTQYVANTMSHELMHGLGAYHTDRTSPGDLTCNDDGAYYLMNSITETGKPQWSECTLQWFEQLLQNENITKCMEAICGNGLVEGDEECDAADDPCCDITTCQLLTTDACSQAGNADQEDDDTVFLYDRNDASLAVCGNGVLEAGEECDVLAGGLAEGDSDPCCNATTCKLLENAKCSALHDACCSPDTCAPRTASENYVCRAKKDSSACDQEEVCDGMSASCPEDTFADVGTSCVLSIDYADGSCYRGECMDREFQCAIRGYFVGDCSTSSCDFLRCERIPTGATEASCYNLAPIRVLDGTRCGDNAYCYQGACKSSVESIRDGTADGCRDGVKNGDETDVDCGGSSCLPCLTSQTCKSDDDCNWLLECDAETHVCFDNIPTDLFSSDSDLSPFLAWISANPIATGVIMGVAGVVVVVLSYICCCDRQLRNCLFPCMNRESLPFYQGKHISPDLTARVDTESGLETHDTST